METLINQINNKVDSITKESLGLGNVDNTHDADKVVKASNYLITQEIETGTDLNNCLQLGFYTCYNVAIAQSLLNSPTLNAFEMTVKRNAGYTQELTEYLLKKPKKWFRNMYNGTWGQWYRIYTEADPQTNLL